MILLWWFCIESLLARRCQHTYVGLPECILLTQERITHVLFVDCLCTFCGCEVGSVSSSVSVSIR